jgi:hypothetical protein
LTGRGGLTGTIEKVEGNIVVVNTPQGLVQTTIGADTAIQQTVPGVLSDLKTGMRVTVSAQRGEDGTVKARSILVVSEGAEGSSSGSSIQKNQ